MVGHVQGPHLHVEMQAERGVKMKMNAIKTSTAAVILGVYGFSALAAPANYPDPAAAVDAFVAALTASDQAALLMVMGTEAQDLISSGDKARDIEARALFLTAYERFHGLTEVGDNERELVVGRTLWPFPVPLIKGDAGWHFDPDEARDEIVSRRIGLNELDVIDVLHKVAGVQSAFHAIDHDDDGVMEYASSIVSTPGHRDGLYWPPEEGTEVSPLGANIALAAADGIAIDGVDQEPVPYLGYYFRILTKQGPDAPGGAYSYMINGNMVAGFAMLAYPAAPGNTGVMSFIVGSNGVIHEANLGDDTLAIAADIRSFNPNKMWTKVEDLN